MDRATMRDEIRDLNIVVATDGCMKTWPDAKSSNAQVKFFSVLFLNNNLHDAPTEEKTYCRLGLYAIEYPCMDDWFFIFMMIFVRYFNLNSAIMTNSDKLY